MPELVGGCVNATGRAGMATVYLAEDLKHHRKVAVQVLRPERAAVLAAEAGWRRSSLPTDGYLVTEKEPLAPMISCGPAGTF